MKTTKIIGIALSVIILGSCASSSDVVDGGLFQKRKYNKGWNINKKAKVESNYSKTNEVEIANASIKFEKESTPTIKDNVASTEKATTTITNESLVSEVLAIEAIETNNEVANTVERTTSAVVNKRRDVKPSQSNRRSLEKSNRSMSLNMSNVSSDSGFTSDAALILLIILAIFIAPLAVGIYEGITTRFWISLLLWLLFVLPGAIYAILIILGII